MNDATNTTAINNRELASILVCAFRYSLSRMTYVVSDCVGWLTKHWGVMPPEWRTLIHREIREAVARNRAGMDFDAREWEKVLGLPIEDVRET